MTVPTSVNSILSETIIKFGAENGAGGSNYIVETKNGAIYLFIAGLNLLKGFKSVDGGYSFTELSTNILSIGISPYLVSVWYERWSGIDGDDIYIAAINRGNHDVEFRVLDTTNDSLSSVSTVFAGASSAAGGSLSISKMRGGNLICVGCIDAGTEIFSKKSTDNGVNWTNITAGYEASGSGDLCTVMPGWDTDTNDAMMFYYDRSATEVSVKYYDDSANSWSETSIATTISFPTTSTAGQGMHWSASVDYNNSRNVLIFWTAIDTANADLRCVKVTQSTVTETANNVILNSPSDQAFCTLTIRPDNSWIVFYFGLSLSSTLIYDLYNITTTLCYKISTDYGETWNTRTAEYGTTPYLLAEVFPLPISYNYKFGLAYIASGLSSTSYQHKVRYVTPFSARKANYQLGI